jgi:hypothetical protein
MTVGKKDFMEISDDFKRNATNASAAPRFAMHDIYIEKTYGRR